MIIRKVFSVQCLVFSVLLILFAVCFAQEADLEFTLDVTSQTIPLPKIFKPNIDLSGRGYNSQSSWPQSLAAKEVLDTWQKDIGFNGIYRLQYDLWNINQLAKDQYLQKALLENYENIIKNITDSGGIVILDIFGTPPGLGKVLDKTSPPIDLKAFKELVKNHIRQLSCQKKYNIWYEVWSAPDQDGFFVGRKQEYLNLYRAVADAIKELEDEFKIQIPVGGPAVSWWFQNVDINTIITPEHSLIYDLIRFCYCYRLPLDFISWHCYSTDPKVEKEFTRYNKNAIALIRDWLSYFKFDKNTPLIVDEWNYDRSANIIPERGQNANICASYIPARIKNMYETGLDYQLFFSLEDFENNKEGVVRNTGIFWFDSKSLEYKGGYKSIYNVFRMLQNLDNEMFVSSLKFNDEFVGIIATKAEDRIVMLIFNYADTEFFNNYIYRGIAHFSDGERKLLLNLIKSRKLEKVMCKELDINRLRLTKRMKALLKKAQELNDGALKSGSNARNIKIDIKNLKGNYIYQRYAVDSSCYKDCFFTPVEEKEVDILDLYQERLVLNPYSVNLIILKKSPPKEINSPNVDDTTQIKKE